MGNNVYEYYRKAIVEAKRNGIDHYNHKFHWSGTGKINAILISTRQTIQLSKQHHDTHDVCRVYFDRPLRKGEQQEINYKLTLIDDSGNAEPFLSHECHDKIGKLILKVRYPNDTQTRNYTRQIFMSPVSEIPIWEEHVTTSLDSKEAFFEVPRPRVGYKYKIIWRKA